MSAAALFLEVLGAFLAYGRWFTRGTQAYDAHAMFRTGILVVLALMAVMLVVLLALPRMNVER